MSDKCPYHEDYLRHLEKQDEFIQKIDNKAQKALDKVDQVENAHLKTETYTKELYKTVEKLVKKVDTLSDQLSGLVTALSVNQLKTERTDETAKKGRDLVYEVIKYLVIALVGYLIASNGNTP